MAEEKKESSKKDRHVSDPPKKSPPAWSLLALQSVACGVVLLITLLFRLAGGDAYAGLQTAFAEAIADDTVMSTIAALFDTDEPDKVIDPREEETTPTESATTTKADTASAVTPPEGYTFLKLETNREADLPLKTGTLTSGYGFRENPTGSGEQFHGGVDIAADAGTPICAMFYGIVTDKGESNSYGRYVELYHGNGLRILYAHCSKVTADIGECVSSGEEVAQVGATGDATGNHVHIEVYRDEQVCDPSALVPVAAYA